MRTLTQQIDDEIERINLLPKNDHNNKVIKYLKKHKENICLHLNNKSKK